MSGANYIVKGKTRYISASEHGRKMTSLQNSFWKQSGEMHEMKVKIMELEKELHLLKSKNNEESLKSIRDEELKKAYIEGTKAADLALKRSIERKEKRIADLLQLTETP